MVKKTHTLLVVILFVSVLQSQSLDSIGFKVKLNRIELHDHEYKPDASIRPVLTRSNFLFTIDAFIGTPSSEKTFIFDTGSALIWTQCKPCINCFEQNYPLFEPNKSTSFQKLSKNHPLSSFFKHSGNGDSIYKIVYMSWQSSSGFAAVETLAFPNTKNGRQAIKGVVFGCSNNAKGQFTNNKMVTGIMGLNRSPLSLVGQMGKASRRFSYCLLDLNFMIKSTFLRFGSDVNVKWSYQKTSFIKGGFDYRVKLLGISVAGRRLNLTEGTFSSEGCIVDVGTTTSHLEMGAYTPVLNAVRQQIDRFNLTRIRGNPEIDGDLCYQLKPGFENNVTMTLHFQGAKYEIGPDNLFRVISGNRLCLALFGSSTTTLGAYQQQNMRLVHDVINGKLLFAKENCSKR